MKLSDVNPEEIKPVEEPLKLSELKEEEVKEVPTTLSLSSLSEEEITPIEEAPEKPMRGIEALVRGAAQGITFNFADEIEASLKSLAPGETYDDVIEKVRAKYEAARKQQPGAFTAGAIGGGIASAFVPVVGPATTLAKGAGLAKATAQAAGLGAVAGVGEAKDITDVKEVSKEAATGALIGAAAAPVLAGAAKIGGYVFKKAGNIAKTKAPTKESADILKEVDNATKNFIPGWKKQADDLFENGIPTELNATTKKQVIEVAREGLGVKSKSLKAAEEAINEARATLSKEDFREVVVNQKTLKATEGILKDLAPTEPAIATKIRDVFDYVIDFMATARGIDKRVNVGITDTLLDGTENVNKYTVELMGYLNKKVPVNKVYTRLADEDKTTLRNALRGAGEFSGLKDAEKLKLLPDNLKEQFKGWRDVFEYGLERANALGVPIKARKDYVPDQMMDQARASVAIESKLKKLGIISKEGKFVGFDQDKITNLIEAKDKDMIDILRTSRYLTGEEFKDADSLNRIMTQAITPGGDVYVNVLKASALFKREGLMPEYLKETDLRKLAARWGQQTFRYGYMKNTLRELRMKEDLLRQAGFKTDAEKVKRLHDGYLGEVKAISKFTQEAKVYLQTRAFKAAEKSDTPAIKNFYEILGEAPDAFQNMTLNVYSNFLGLSPRAMVQNITGGLYMMVPELGNIYGSKVAIPAYMRAVMKAGSRKYWKELQDKGFTQAQWSTELKEAITRGRPRGFIGQNLDRVSDVVMKGFEYSELLNRAVVYESGKEITKDLFKKSASAAKYLNTMPKSTKGAIEKAISSGDKEIVERLVTRYLADRTLFSYNRITQSDLSRAVGPLFSMFTKYPSAVAGRAVNVFREEGAVGGGVELARFMAVPIVVGALFNKVFMENNPEMEEILFGRPAKKDAPVWARGVALSSPVYSVKSILEGRMFTPPLVGVGREITTGTFELFEGNPDRLGRALKNAAESFAPGGATAIIRAAETYTDIDVPLLGKEK